jgi:ATP-dependent Clp protease protease subunit
MPSKASRSERVRFRERVTKALAPSARALLRAPKWRAEVKDETVEIVAYGPVFSGPALFEGEITDVGFAQALDRAGGKPVCIRLNSPGGDAFAGIAIANLLRSYAGDVTVQIDGIAASAASVIAMGADELRMAKGSQLMIHRAWTMAMGNSEDLGKTVAFLAQLDADMASLYAERSTLSAEEAADMMARETYMSVKQAAKHGFIRAEDGEEDPKPPESEDTETSESEDGEDTPPESEGEEEPSTEDPECEDDKEAEAKAAAAICKLAGVKSLAAAEIVLRAKLGSLASSEKTELINTVKDRLGPAEAKALASKPMSVVRQVVKALKAAPAPAKPRSIQQGTVKAAAPRIVYDTLAKSLNLDPTKLNTEIAARRAKYGV